MLEKVYCVSVFTASYSPLLLYLLVWWVLGNRNEPQPAELCRHTRPSTSLPTGGSAEVCVLTGDLCGNAPTQKERGPVYTLHRFNQTNSHAFRHTNINSNLFTAYILIWHLFWWAPFVSDLSGGAYVFSRARMLIMFSYNRWDRMKTVGGEYVTTRENSTGSNKQWARACIISGWWGKTEMIGRMLMMMWDKPWVDMWVAEVWKV